METHEGAEKKSAPHRTEKESRWGGQPTKEGEAMASETRHTPGPWAQDGGSKRLIWGECDGRDVLVADLAVPGISKARPTLDEQLANARLIAAAPDMLAALRIYFSEPERFHKAASDAIAKAEGK